MSVLTDQATDGRVEVRIRHENDAEGAAAFRWPIEQIDSLIPLLCSWGIYMNSDGEVHTSLSGQFVLGDDGAYFEVIVHEDDE